MKRIVTSFMIATDASYGYARWAASPTSVRWRRRSRRIGCSTNAGLLSWKQRTQGAVGLQTRSAQAGALHAADYSQAGRAHDCLKAELDSFPCHGLRLGTPRGLDGFNPPLPPGPGELLSLCIIKLSTNMTHAAFNTVRVFVQLASHPGPTGRAVQVGQCTKLHQCLRICQHL